MKKSGICLGLLLGLLTCGRAQVTVEVTQDQQQFLPGESLKVAVRITNRSGQELHLGGEEDWLGFAIETAEGSVVPKLGDAPVVGAFALENSKVAIKRVDLAPYFMLSRPGTYQIVATLKIREWNRELMSDPKSFDVIQGVKIWEQEVGVPNSRTPGEPELRHYILQQANYIRGQIRLYLRVTDSYGKSVRVYAIGPMVSFGRPETQVDSSSHLHVLHQEKGSLFSYTEFNHDGDLLLRQTYEYTDSRPRLRMNDNGDVRVIGGGRRIAASDVPAPSQDDENGPASPTTPTSEASATTNQPGTGKVAR